MTPIDFKTLMDMLVYRAEVSAAKAAFTFKDEACPFDELWKNINRFASFLHEHGIERNECVLIALPNSAEFFFAFYGVQRAGGIAAPIFPQSE